MNKLAKGEYVYCKIKELGYPMIFVSQKLEISKKTLLNKLKSKKVEKKIITKISNIINFDLENGYFNEICNNLEKEFINRSKILNQQQEKLADIKLKYNALLDFIISLANEYSMKKLKKRTYNHIKKSKNKNKKDMLDI